MTSPTPDGAVSRARQLLLAAAVAVLGLSLLMAVQLTLNRSAIENRLERHAVEALIRTGISGVTVTVDGRDAVLRGSSLSDLDAQRAIDTVADIDGMRVVRDEIDTQRGAPVEGEGGAGQQTVQLTISVLGGRITLTGTVPDDDARDEMVDAAASQVGQDDVIDDLLIDDTLEGLPSAETLLEGIDAVTEVVDDLDPAANGLIELSDGVITLTGRVPTQVARDDLVAAANSVLADPSRIVDQLLIEDETLSPQARAFERRLARLPEIEFSAGGSDLDGEALDIVRDAAEILQSAPDLRVRVEAHTSASGSDLGNLRLSQDRADAVRDALIDEGVDADRIDAVGYGESRPLPAPTDDDAEGQRDPDRDRRVVFEVVP